MSEIPDVVVVGGGPAGSTVAGLLARRGRRVVLLEKARFPRPKPCGECLNPGAVGALDRLGLLEVVRALDPVELRGWDLWTGGGRRAEGRFGAEVGPALAVSRRRLDHALLEEARRRGVRVREGVRVLDSAPGEEGGPATLRVGRGGRRRGDGDGAGVRRARVVVGADGLRSVVARSVGAIHRRPELRKVSLTCRVRGAGPAPDRGRLVLRDGGTLGLAPVTGNGPGGAAPRLWNATVVVDAELGPELGPDPEGFAKERIGRWIPDWTEPPALVGGPWASGPFDWPVRRVVVGNVVLVGDAAGYYDPLTGQGIFRALRSAELAADAIDRALDEDRVSTGGALDRYARRLPAEFAPGRRLQRLVEGVVSRRLLRELCLAGLERAPGLTSALIRVTGDAKSGASNGSRDVRGSGTWKG